LNPHDPKERNTKCLPLFGGGGDPTGGAFDIFFGAHALRFHHPHPILCLHITLIRRQPELPIGKLGLAKKPGVTAKPSTGFVAQTKNCQ